MLTPTMPPSRYEKYLESIPEMENHQRERYLLHGTENRCNGQGCADRPCGLCGILANGFLRRFMKTSAGAWQRFGRDWRQENSASCTLVCPFCAESPLFSAGWFLPSAHRSLGQLRILTSVVPIPRQDLASTLPSTRASLTSTPLAL